jgi:hypothetical protein
MAFPRAASPSLSIEDETWRREHAAQMAAHREPPRQSATRLRAV